MPCNLNPPARSPPRPEASKTWRGIISTWGGDSAGLGWGSGICFLQGFQVIPLSQWPLLCGFGRCCGSGIIKQWVFFFFFWSFLDCLSYPQLYIVIYVFPLQLFYVFKVNSSYHLKLTSLAWRDHTIWLFPNGCLMVVKINKAFFMLCSEVPPWSYIKFTCVICSWHLLFLWSFSFFLN